ncbi:LUD domain-containing protein [Halorussus litoreus]|uniref:LUD domain-containing protein n=1 Tax=Halorussus litoreus TaxID=1710536 RepID=UPI000E26535E|nr:LUD domain-containing protein [Halorussus litoreus]
MSAAATSEFEESLRELGVTWSRTAAAEFEDAIGDAVVGPAVGTPLPFEGVSLAGTEVARDPTPNQLDAATTGVTPAAFAIADYGSVVLRPDETGVEPVSLYPERHVAVLAEGDVVADMPTAFERLGETFRRGGEESEDGEDGGDGESVVAGSDAILATGPSATADMGALVTGAHGPKEVHVVVLEDR